MCLGSSHASRNGSPDHRRLIDAHDPERRDIGQGRQAFDQRLFEADGLRLPEGRTIGRNHNGLGGIWRSRPPQKGRQVSRRQMSGALEHGSREFAGRRQVVRGKEVRQGRGQFADDKQIEITRLEGRNCGEAPFRPFGKKSGPRRVTAESQIAQIGAGDHLLEDRTARIGSESVQGEIGRRATEPIEFA